MASRWSILWIVISDASVGHTGTDCIGVVAGHGSIMGTPWNPRTDCDQWTGVEIESTSSDLAWNAQ